eukprot:scaffold174390_cov14-Prasinocladus_malaysianus.AAC.1
MVDRFLGRRVVDRRVVVEADSGASSIGTGESGAGAEFGTASVGSGDSTSLLGDSPLVRGQT